MTPSPPLSAVSLVTCSSAGLSQELSQEHVPPAYLQTSCQEMLIQPIGGQTQKPAPSELSRDAAVCGHRVLLGESMLHLPFPHI
jgi:hypothetical protein